MTRSIIFGWLMLVIRMYLLWKPSGCFILISVVWPSLRQSGYERRVTCIRMGVIRMVIRASCHHEVRGTCSQEGGPYSNLIILITIIVFIFISTPRSIVHTSSSTTIQNPPTPLLSTVSPANNVVLGVTYIRMVLSSFKLAMMLDI